jgi:hypothetical protein
MDNRRQLAAIQLTDQFDRMSFIGGSFHCVHYASTSGVRSPEGGVVIEGIRTLFFFGGFNPESHPALKRQ